MVYVLVVSEVASFPDLTAGTPQPRPAPQDTHRGNQDPEGAAIFSESDSKSLAGWVVGLGSLSLYPGLGVASPYGQQFPEGRLSAFL